MMLFYFMPHTELVLLCTSKPAILLYSKLTLPSTMNSCHPVLKPSIPIYRGIRSNQRTGVGLTAPRGNRRLTHRGF